MSVSSARWGVQRRRRGRGRRHRTLVVSRAPVPLEGQADQVLQQSRDGRGLPYVPRLAVTPGCVPSTGLSRMAISDAQAPHGVVGLLPVNKREPHAFSFAKKAAAFFNLAAQHPHLCVVPSSPPW